MHNLVLMHMKYVLNINSIYISTVAGPSSVSSHNIHTSRFSDGAKVFSLFLFLSAINSMTHITVQTKFNILIQQECIKYIYY